MNEEEGTFTRDVLFLQYFPMPFLSSIVVRRNHKSSEEVNISFAFFEGFVVQVYHMKDLESYYNSESMIRFWLFQNIENDCYISVLIVIHYVARFPDE
jgi:hypothetical protein